MVIKEKGALETRSKAPTINETPLIEAININDYLFDLQTPLPDEEVIVSIQGKIVATTHNIMVITGKPKSRKSVIAHSIISSALSKISCLGIECNIGNSDVVLLDTEQGKHDLYRSLTRMKALGNMDKFPANLKTYALRSISCQQIIYAIEQILITNLKVKLLIIDGGLDLINNMNDVIESKKIIDFLKVILDKYNICIVMILHQSKSSEHTMGHLGSFLDRFCQTNLSVIKEKDGTGTIKPVMMRSSHDFEPYGFYYNHHINNYSIGYLEKDEITIRIPSDLSPEKHLAKLKKIFAYKNNFLYKDLIIVCTIEYKKTESWCKGLIKHLFDLNLINKTENGIELL